MLVTYCCHHGRETTRHTNETELISCNDHENSANNEDEDVDLKSPFTPEALGDYGSLESGSLGK